MNVHRNSYNTFILSIALLCSTVGMFAQEEASGLTGYESQPHEEEIITCSTGSASSPGFETSGKELFDSADTNDGLSGASDITGIPTPAAENTQARYAVAGETGGLAEEAVVPEAVIEEQVNMPHESEVLLPELDEDALEAIVAEAPDKRPFDIWLDGIFENLIEYRVVSGAIQYAWVGKGLLLLHDFAGALYIPDAAEWVFDWWNRREEEKSAGEHQL